MKKSVLLILLFIAVIVTGLVLRYYVLTTGNHVRQNIANENSTIVTADNIITEFKANEVLANKKYLNKNVSITGEISNIDTDTNGNISVILKGSDSTADIFCTLKSATNNPAIGSTVTINGICTGLVLSDVVLNEAVIIK